MVDLVNRQGEIIEPAVPRNEADGHPELLMQVAVVVVVNDKGHILVHERSNDKTVDPGLIDHVCGGVQAGETPEQAARREAYEETGLELDELHLVSQSVNSYNRFKHLFLGRANGKPRPEPGEANWSDWRTPFALRSAQQSKVLGFVGHFAEDTDNALEKLRQLSEDSRKSGLTKLIGGAISKLKNITGSNRRDQSLPTEQ